MRLKKVLSLIASAVMSCSAAVAFAGCGANDNGANPAAPANTDPYDIPQDYCRTYYEVFVRSFADGNGDGKGDIRGLIDNLDYLNDGDDTTTADLGVNGIWLMPIMPSPSYHGYDVTDYKNINPDYGTLEDFDELVSECNKRGIWIQIDLVLNHTASSHPWFAQARADARAGGETAENSEAMKRYCIYKEDEKPSTGTFYNISDSEYYYLGNFSSSMPDLNLDNEDVRNDIKDIVDFWLERGVRSFRLDAVPWAYADSSMYTEANGEFWTWFNDYCDKKGKEVFGADGDGIARYCYNVGEVWSGNSDIEQFFTTGMTAFNYSMGATPDTGFAELANGFASADAAWTVNKLATIQAGVLAKDENALLSNFLSNHDNDRSAGYFYYDPVKIKKAAALYLLAPGNPYIYYGEEIGAAGSGVDPNKRLPFNWGDGRYKIKNPQGANYKGKQELGTWKSQNTDPNSVLTFYRNAIKLRNRFPEIGRGVIAPYAIDSAGKIVARTEETASSANDLNYSVAVYTLTWNSRKVLIVQNTGDRQATLDISDFSGYGLVGELKANGGSVSLVGATLKMSGATVAVLKAF